MGFGTPATVALERAGVRYLPHAYEHVSGAAGGFGAEAARALGQDPDRVFKTLLVDVEGAGVAVGVVPVAGSLDLKAIARAAGGKRAQLVRPEAAERRTGYVVGGISPIAQKTPAATFVDETAQLWDTVFVSGGRRGFDIELAPADLLAVTGGVYAAIAAP